MSGAEGERERWWWTRTEGKGKKIGWPNEVNSILGFLVFPPSHRPTGKPPQVKSTPPTRPLAVPALARTTQPPYDPERRVEPDEVFFSSPTPLDPRRNDSRDLRDDPGTQRDPTRSRRSGNGQASTRRARDVDLHD